MITIIKMVIAAGAFLFIILKIIGQLQNGQWQDLSSFRPAFFLLGLLLVPINWLFEALKWKILTQRFQKLSVIQSYKAVLNGLTVSLFTPNRIGEFAGRILSLNHENRIRGVSGTLFNSIATMAVIFVFGFWALFSTGKLPEPFDNYTGSPGVFIGIGLLLMISVVLTFFILPTVTRYIHIAKWPKVNQFVEAFQFYSFRESIHLFLLSVLRYLVFSLQFYLMLRFTGITPNILLSFKAICLVYLLITIIPSFAMVELGIRSSLAVLFLTPIINQPVQIIEATIILWISNIAIPALAGSFILYKTKVEL